MTAIRFTLNGEPCAEDGAPPATTVLDWLRGRARLTGTKEGCAEGDCGACTIAIARPDEVSPRWVAVNSCLMLLPQLDGCAVLTVEGLSPPEGPLHRVQQALVDHDATQCGFCTPGFAMAMFAFAEAGSAPDDAAIHEALAGNLCRCTGYRSIVDACRRLADGSAAQQEAADHSPEGSVSRGAGGASGEAGGTSGTSEALAPGLPSPLWGGSDRHRRSGAGVIAAGTEDGKFRPHPRPLPTRGVETPWLPDDSKEKTAALVYDHDGQRFYAPTALDELLALRENYPDALLYAGGTDLGLRASKHREALPLVISTAKVEALRHVAEADGVVEIGAAATYAEALPLVEEHFPAFGALIRRIGSQQIRNLGTFAGNIATASPIGDTLPCLIALQAEVVLARRGGERRMAVEHFITGYRKTALAPGEVIAAIRIPYLPAGENFAAYKLSKRFDQDISTVVAGFRLRIEEGRVAGLIAAFGGMAARPARATALEEALAGRIWDAAALDDADALLAQDFAPLSDHRGGAIYRLRAAAGLLRRFQMETGAATPIRLEAL